MIAVVEMPLGTRYKYEFDKSDGKLIVDRLIPIPCPYNYGFIPETLCEDGDPLDIFIISEEPVNPGSKVRVQIVDMIECVDNGEQDDKLVGIIEGDTLEPGVLADSVDKIKTYLDTYKPGMVTNPRHCRNVPDLINVVIRTAGEKYARQLELYGAIRF